MLDILFIHSNASTEIYQELSKEHSAIETPIWAGLLAQHCRTRNFGVQILDCEAERINYKEAATRIKEINPRIACFVVYGQQPSASTQNMEGAVATVRELKLLDPTIKTMFVGGHVSALPLEVLAEDSIDFICQNEGVYTISSLLSCPDFKKSNLEKVLGLGWKDEGHLVRNDINPIVPQDLLEQDLPGIAWDLLPPPTKYRTAGWHSWSNNSIKTPFASLYTSLGCPFRCSFCMINIINRTDKSLNVASDKSSVFRYWKPEFIIEQFDQMAKMGVKNVKIADELFVLKEPHFMRICELLTERKYDFNIWCYSRIDTCKPHYLEALKKAGVNWIGLGIESPDQVIRKDVIKGGYKEVKIIDIVNSIRDAGINVGANYIFGLPLDDERSLKYTLDFAIDANTENCNLYSAMCYPGSPLYFTAKEKNWTLPSCYAGYSQHSYHTQNLPTNYLTAAEVLRFRDSAWVKYFTGDRFLTMLRNKFGEAAYNDVVNSSKIKLKRKLLGD